MYFTNTTGSDTFHYYVSTGTTTNAAWTYNPVNTTWNYSTTIVSGIHEEAEAEPAEPPIAYDEIIEQAEGAKI